MKYGMIAVIAFAGLASAALAAGDPMAAAYENTVVSTDETGGQSKVMYNADHTYTVIRPDGAAGKGTWSIKDGQLCVNRTEPVPPVNFCMGLDGIPSQVGDSKQTTTTDGRKFTNTMTAGRS